MGKAQLQQGSIYFGQGSLKGSIKWEEIFLTYSLQKLCSAYRMTFNFDCLTWDLFFFDVTFYPVLELGCHLSGNVMV